MSWQWLWVGLGNPGPPYQFTRHNFGFLVLEYWAKEKGLSFRKAPFAAEWAFLGREIALLKPLTFMNLSGTAVACCLQELGLPQERLLLIHDDLDLPLGRIRFAPKGGSGGHRGVQSVIDALGTKDFPRLRLGIGRPPQGVSVRDFVLSPFTEEEWPLVKKVIFWASSGLETLRTQGLQKTMSLFNRPLPEKI